MRWKQQISLLLCLVLMLTGIYPALGGERVRAEAASTYTPIMVPNGDFEEAADAYPQWTTVPVLPQEGLQVTVTQEKAASGSNSLYMADDSSSKSLEVKSALIPITGGEMYRATASIFVTGKSVRMYMRFLKSGSSTDLSGGAVNILQNTVGSWKETTLEAAAPQEAEFVQITFYYGGSGVGTYAYIDNVRLDHKEVANPLELPYGDPVLVGDMVSYALSQSATYGIGPDGLWEQYVTTTGSPVSFHVVDAITGDLKFTQQIAGSSDVIWGMTKASDGNVYFSTNGILYRYNVMERSIEALGENPSNKQVFDLKASSDGKIYGGTYSNVNMGKVFEYDIATNTFRDLGVMKEGQQYARGLGVTDNYVYVGIGTEAHIMRYDRATGEITEVIIPGVSGTTKTISEIDIYGGKLFAYSGKDLFVIDEATHELVTTLEFQTKISPPSPYDPNLIYYKLNGDLYTYDIAKNETTQVTGIPELPADTAIKGHAWITPQSGPFAGRQVLAGMAAFGESFLYDPTTNSYEEHVAELPSSPTTINAMETDGEYLYFGGYQRGMSVYDLKQEELVYENSVFHQPEGIGFLNGSTYLGTYSGAVMYQLDMDQPLAYSERGTGNPGMVLDIEDGQDRPFTMTSGDGKLFIGTFPIYGQLGGALTIMESDSVTGTTYETFRNVVPNQSLFGLAYRNGKVYGGTSVWGGLGITPTESEAKLFVFDTATKQVTQSFTPRIPGVDGEVKLIGELSIGPDGLLWGILDGYIDQTNGYDAAIFAMNPDTLEIVKSAVITKSPYNTSKYRPYYLRWGADGLIYTTIGRKLFAIDPSDLNSKQIIPNTVNLMTLGPDGSIYYTQGSNLYKIPVQLESAALTLSATSLQVGATAEGSVVVLQKNGMQADTTHAMITYTSSDPSIVSVNGDQLTAVTSGTVNITATVTFSDGRTITSNPVMVTVEQVASNEGVVDLGAPIQTPQTIDAAYGQENGVNVVYTTVTGSASAEQWAKFNVIDIDNQRLLASYPLEGASNAWSHVRTVDGRVFIGASKKMFVYSPATRKVTDLGVPIPGTESIWSLTADEQGNVYGGIYSGTIGGRVFRIDAQTLEITDLLGGRVDDGTGPVDDGKAENYVRSIAYYDGYVYAGTGTSNGRVWKIDPVTKEKVMIELPGAPEDPIYNGRYNAMGAVYDISIVDKYLFAFFNGPFTMHVYDLELGQWREKAISNVRGLKATTPAHNGKVYTNKRDKYMWEIDVTTLEERQVMYFDGSIRSSSWMQVKNQPDFPGTSLVTISYDGRVVLYDPPNGRSLAMRQLVEGQANNIQAMETGPDGKIYMSSYMGTKGAQYDPATDTFTQFALGQAEGMGAVGDTLYFGVYPKAEIHAWDTIQALPTNGPPLIFSIGNDQDRPFVLTEGDGKLLIGTIPGYSKHGGALTVYDPVQSAESGQAVYEVFPNIVENQSITGLAYKDGLVFGSTSIHGGLGADPIATRAKLFVWDMATKQKVGEWDLQLDGLSSTVPMISGLTVGADGLIWGAANGFVFAFDPQTHAIVKSRNIYPEVTNYGRWRQVHQRWGKDGLLYSDLGGRLTVINPETLESQKLQDNVGLFTLDGSNQVYFADAIRVKRIDAEIPEALTLSVPAAVEKGQTVPIQVLGQLYGWDVNLAEEASFVISDPALATVENGQLVALRTGAVTITASYLGTQSSTVTVTITEPESDRSILFIRNAGFEEDVVDGVIPGWTGEYPQDGVSLIEVSSEQAKSGSNSLKIIDASTSGHVTVLSDPIPVEGGRKYITEADVYLGPPPQKPAGGTYSSSRTLVRVYYYDANDTKLIEKYAIIDSPRGEWLPVKIESIAPENAAYARVVLTCSISWVTTAYYDEVKMYTLKTPEDQLFVEVQFPSGPVDLAEGSDGFVTVKATQGAQIKVMEGASVVAEGTGAGDAPVTLTIPAPAVGTHQYTVQAEVTGVGTSDPVTLPQVTVYPLSGIRLNAESITLAIGDEHTIITEAVYGPVKKDVSADGSFSVSPGDVVTVQGQILKAVNSGTATVTVAYGGMQATISVIVPVKSYMPILNAGFEKELAADRSIVGWKVRSFDDSASLLEISTEQAKSGTHSLKLIDASTSTSTSLQSELISVAPGREYVAEFNVYLGPPPKRPGEDSYFSSSRTLVQLRYYDAEGRELTSPTPGATVTAPPAEWIPVQLTSTAPASAKYARLILINSISWVGTAYYDDMAIYTMVHPDEMPQMEIVAPTTTTDAAEGFDVTVSVKATKDAIITVKEGDAVVAQGIGNGDEVVDLVIPSPAVGTHQYQVSVELPGVGTTQAIPVPAITVYALSSIQLSEEEIELVLDDTYNLLLEATYGPVTKDVSSLAEIIANREDALEVNGHTLKALKPGLVRVNVTFGELKTELRIMIKPK